MTLNPGDILSFYTDGLVELQNTLKKEWSISNLRKVVQQNASRSAEQIVEIIRNDLKGFMRGTAQYDDMTLIVMGRKKEARQTQ